MVITLQPSDAIFGYMGGEKREEKKGEEVEGHGKGRGREREREESGRGGGQRRRGGTWNRVADWLRPALFQGGIHDVTFDPAVRHINVD